MNTTPASRIIGLDIARALAIIGMMYAHIVWADDGLGHEITSGYPSTLFAVLSGMSVHILMTRYGRTVVTARSLWLLGLSAVLAAFSGSIAIVVGMIALAQMILAPCVAWEKRKQLKLLAALFVFGPLLSALFETDWAGFLGDGMYPLGAWLFYTLLGIVMFDYLQARWFVWWIAAGAVAFGVRLALFFAGIDEDKFRSHDDAVRFLAEITLPEPHTGLWSDMLFTAAVAMGVIALTRKIRLMPLQAFGSMALSVYVVHVLLTGLSASSAVVEAMGFGANPTASTTTATATVSPSPSPFASPSPSPAKSPAPSPELGVGEKPTTTDKPSDSVPATTSGEATISPQLVEQGLVNLDAEEVQHYLEMTPEKRQAVADVLVTHLNLEDTPEAARSAMMDMMYLLYSPEEDYEERVAMPEKWQKLREEVLAAPTPDDAVALAVTGAQRIEEEIYEQEVSIGEVDTGQDVLRQEWGDFALQLVVLLVACTLYRLRWRRGPFEWALHRLGVRALAAPDQQLTPARAAAAADPATPPVDGQVPAVDGAPTDGPASSPVASSADGQGPADSGRAGQNP